MAGEAVCVGSALWDLFASSAGQCSYGVEGRALDTESWLFPLAWYVGVVKRGVLRELTLEVFSVPGDLNSPANQWEEIHCGASMVLLLPSPHPVHTIGEYFTPPFSPPNCIQYCTSPIPPAGSTLLCSDLS